MSVVFIGFAVVLSLAVLLAIKSRRHKRERAHLVQAVNDALQRSFRDLPLPQLTVSYSYGFPSFQLDFASRANHQQAADSGAVSRFMSEIQHLCRTRGTRENPFDARKALHCTDPEHQRKLKEWAAQERGKFDEERGSDA